MEYHKLSGAFFRQKNEETGEIEAVCFEELREEEQDRILKSCTEEWKNGMIKMLSATIRDIGEQFNIYKH